MWAGCSVNFAESVATLQEDLREISPTAFLSVPRIWEKMHSNINIKIKDSIFIKRWVFDAMMPIGEKVAGHALSGKPVRFSGRSFTAGLPASFQSLAEFHGPFKWTHICQWRRPHVPGINAFLSWYRGAGPGVLWNDRMRGNQCYPRKNKFRAGQVGQAIPGIEIKLAADGEIMLKGDSVFKGYYGNPEQTADAFDRGRWLMTGDVGEFTDEGQLKIVDRKKDLIINAYGKNIAPSEIENKLKFSPFIKEGIVVGDGRKYLSAPDPT